MPRPTPPPHPISGFFTLLREEQGIQVGASTEKKYLMTIRAMERSKKAPVDWLSSRSKELQCKKTRAARTTIGVLRSAVTYYLRWQHHEHTGELLTYEEAVAEFAGKKLTSAAHGKKGESRAALTAAQYTLYIQTVWDLPTHPQIRAVLLLLPLTGLRISEACGVKREDVVVSMGTWTLDVVGKGDKRRLVPLSEDAIDLLRPFYEEAEADGYLFPNPCLGLPGSTRPDLSPAQVRAVVRGEIQTVEGLEEVIPHRLRHQFATMTVKENINVFTAMAVLGHSDLATMQRYAHPDEEMKREVVNVVSEALDNLGARKETAADRRRRQLDAKKG